MKSNFKKDQVKDIAEGIVEKIKGKKWTGAKVIALYGTLGVGKTTFTQSIAKILGLKKNIISPTFVIMKSYELPNNSNYINYFKKLIHIDAYRFKDENETTAINLNELMKDKNNLIIIEWPEIIEKTLNKEVFRIKLEHIDNETRSIEF